MLLKPLSFSIGPFAYSGKDGGVGGGYKRLRRSSLIKQEKENLSSKRGWPSPGFRSSGNLSGFATFKPCDFDHRNMMDPEPRRCRRTDGKKWRCYLDALVNQKYCERHMHRGSQRSRKRVEISKVDLISDQVADKINVFSSSIISPRIAETVGKMSASVSRKHVEVSTVDLSSYQVADDTSGFSPYIISPRVAETVSKMSASVSRKHVEDSKVDLSCDQVAHNASRFNSCVISPGVAETVSKMSASVSKKHVEVSIVDLSSDQLAHNASGFSSSIISPRVAATVSKTSALVSTGLHLGVSSSDLSWSGLNIKEEKGSGCVQAYHGTPGSLSGALAIQDSTRRESNRGQGMGFSFDQTITSHTTGCNQQNTNNPDVSVAPEFGLSPKGFFQSCIGSRVNFDNKAAAGAESSRCRRTDGKRWQCKKNAVTNQKYCESHIHRGSKRNKVDSKMKDSPGIISAGMVGSYSIPKTSKDNRTLNIDLTISLAQNSGHQSVNNSSNSSSDATTVTDENVTRFYDLNNHSVLGAK